MANLTIEAMENQIKELQVKNYIKLMASLKVLNPGKSDEDIVAIYADQAKAAKKAAKPAKKAE